MSLVRFRSKAYGRVAQAVEHLTFNQVVRGSNPRTLIFKKRKILKRFFAFLFKQQILDLTNYSFSYRISVNSLNVKTFENKNKLGQEVEHDKQNHWNRFLRTGTDCNK